MYTEEEKMQMKQKWEAILKCFFVKVFKLYGSLYTPEKGCEERRAAKRADDAFKVCGGCGSRASKRCTGL